MISFPGDTGSFRMQADHSGRVVGGGCRVPFSSKCDPLAMRHSHMMTGIVQMLTKDGV